MSPRQRKESNRGLPAHLRVRAGYYSWRNPEDGVEHGLGRERRYAIEQAIKANAHLAAKRVSLVERISGAAQTWGEWCDVFEKILAARDAKPNTRRVRAYQLARARTIFKTDTPVGRIETRDCASAIQALIDAGKQRTAQAFRSFLIDCFDRMIAKGWRKDNPARVLDDVRVKVKRARLTLETFQKVYETTSIAWLRNAMALAIVSGQPRECIAAAKFADIHDGLWFNERGKTGARIALPIEIRLDCIGLSIEDVIRQCRKTGIASHYLIHQTERKKGATLGKKMHIDMLTRVFRWELLKQGLDWGGKEPPSFHEIRSLAGRLHREEGRVNPQELLGHKDPRTTAVYTDGRGEWVKVGVRK